VDLAASSLGAYVRPETVTALRRASSSTQALALLLMSPRISTEIAMRGYHMTLAAAFSRGPARWLRALPCPMCCLRTPAARRAWWS